MLGLVVRWGGTGWTERGGVLQGRDPPRSDASLCLIIEINVPGEI